MTFPSAFSVWCTVGLAMCYPEGELMMHSHTAILFSIPEKDLVCITLHFKKYRDVVPSGPILHYVSHHASLAFRPHNSL